MPDAYEELGETVSSMADIEDFPSYAALADALIERATKVSGRAGQTW